MGVTPGGFESHRPHPGACRLDVWSGVTTRVEVGGKSTNATREAAKVRERLARVQEALKRVRASERVLAEQVAYLDEVAADAETRKLVAQTPLADREWQEARTDRDRHAALLEEARGESSELLTERDRLLERLFDLEGTT
ncbi:MAG: hypothetical protein KY461_15105 [Actinobacteria bacterium]|nr:hypothetical protein [Actinomycetota bacterium]